MTEHYNQILRCKIRGVNLAAKDGAFGQSDPFLIIKVDRPNGTPFELYKSEVKDVVNQNLNPEWREFRIKFEEIGSLDAKVTLECWDHDTMTEPDSIGYCYTKVSEILQVIHFQDSRSNARRNFLVQKRELVLIDAKGRSIPCGSLRFDHAELESTISAGVQNEDGHHRQGISISNVPQVPPTAGSVDIVPTIPESELRFHILKCKLRGVNLPAKDASFGLSDPYFVFRVNRLDNSSYEIYRSEIISQNLNPEWKEAQLKFEDIGSLDRRITVECWDYDTMSEPDAIGYCYTTAADILKKQELVLIDTKGRQMSCGVLKFDYAELKPESSGNGSGLAAEGFLHVAVISGHDIPERDGYFTKYSEAKVYVALNFRGMRKCSKVVTQAAGGIPTEWADEIIWSVDRHAQGAEHELMAVELCWESSVRDQKIGAVAVTVPATKDVVQQKLWQLETTKSKNPVSVLLRCWISDNAALEANDKQSVEMRELGEASVDAPVDLHLDEITLGMYKVNVEVLEARGLPLRPSHGICSPCVCIQIDGGKKHFTSCVTRSGEHAAWYETFSFDLSVNDPMDLRRAKLLVKCLDEGFVSNHLIGSFDVELAFIYAQSQHEIFRRWITLFNFQDEGAKGIQGLLLLSVSVLGPGDKAAAHNDIDHLANSEEKGDSGIGILVSPSVERKGYLVELRIYRAESLPQMDFTVSSALGGQGIDAYVRLKFGGDSYSSRTSIVKNRNPTFNEAIFCPVVVPSYSDTIEVNLMDSDCFDSDDYIATLFLSFQDLLSHADRYDSPQWWNLYGAPPCSDPWPAIPGPGGRMERSARAINKGERAGLSWRGRVLMSFHVSACPMKELRCRTEPTPIAPLKRSSTALDSEPRYARFLFVFKLYFACNVTNNSKVHVLVKVGDQVVCKSQENSALNGVVSWWEMLYGSFDVPLEHSSSDTNVPSVAWHSCPDVFVDLRNQKSRLGFIRIDLKACQNQSDPRWHVILPDEFDGCGPESGIQGMLLFQARTGIVSEIAPTINVQEKIITRPQEVRYCLHAHLYLAENLLANSDSINPYVVLSCCGQSWKSKAIDGCQFPAWYESFNLEFNSFKDKAYVSPLMIQVFDRNQILASEVLGFTMVSATSLLEKSQEDVTPLWYDLYHPDENPVQRSVLSKVPGARILIALQLLPVVSESCKRCGVMLPTNATSCPACSAVALTGSHIPSRILPVMKICTVQLFIYALRDLMPCGVLPMAAPFLSASLASINLSTRSSDRPNPLSPNVLQTLVFNDVLIPINSDFAPAITIRASDRRFAGVVFLGSTPVHLAEYLPWISVDDRRIARKARLVREDAAGLKVFPDRASANPGNQAVVSSPTVAISFKFKVCVNGQVYNVNHNFGDDVVSCNILPYLKGRQSIDCELEHKLLDDQGLDPASEDCGISTYCLTRHVRQYFFSETLAQCSGRLKMEVRVSEMGKDLARPPPWLESSKHGSTYVVRLYILQAEGLASEDSNGSADPYLVVSLGKQEISCRNNAKSRCLNPVFHQRFEFQTELPGASILKINLMDADTLTKDDLIGSTIIDLEERIMSKQWMLTGQGDDSKAPMRPVEIRRLKTPGSGQCRGTVKLWLDIFTIKEARLFPAWNIAIEPQPYMLRVVVWRVREAKSMDPVTDQNDLYIVGRVVGVNLDGVVSTDRKQTDTHWRCKKGVGSFNWRWNFPLTLPLQDLQLTIQAWDHDIVGSDDLVGETTLSLQQLVSSAIASENQGKAEPLRFPSSRVIDKTLAQEASESSPLNKRDKRTLHRIKSLLARGEKPESIALQLKQEQGADESQLWTAERIGTIAQEGGSSDQCIGGLKRCLLGAMSCLSSAAGLSNAVSPNATAWLPLYSHGQQDEGEMKSDSCFGCVSGKKADSWCQGMHSANSQCTGWIEVEAELVPMKYFEEHQSGEGREEPNAHPKLPPPDRVSLTGLWYRPDRLAYEILGPDLCWKMVLVAVITTFIIGLVHTLPLIITNIYTSSRIANKIPASWTDPTVVATPRP